MQESVLEQTAEIDKLVVRDGCIQYHGEFVANCSSLLLDPQFKISGTGVTRRVLPGRIDAIFAARSLVVGVESKRPSDLVSSYRSGRLQRQIRTMRQLCDVVAIMFRGGWTDQVWGGAPNELWGDFLRWQLHGIKLLPGPIRDEELVGHFTNYKRILERAQSDSSSPEGRDVWRALARTDRRPQRKRGALLLAIPGVGNVSYNKLIAKYATVKDALLATDKEWKAAGMSRTAIDGRKAALA